MSDLFFIVEGSWYYKCYWIKNYHYNYVLSYNDKTNEYSCSNNYLQILVKLSR